MSSDCSKSIRQAAMYYHWPQVF